jgi:polyhydroxyalkanoate synthesis regulator phasin
VPATGRLARTMSLPPDRPTEPLRPAPAPAPAPRQPVVAYEPAPPPAVDVTAVLVRLEDAINSARTGLMIVGVIAVAALGVAIYALVKDNGTSPGGGTNSSRIATLNDRVDRLSRQVQDARAKAGSSNSADTSALGDRVDALERTVKTLADRPQPGDATQAVKELSSRIDTIATDVEQLKSAQSP